MARLKTAKRDMMCTPDATATPTPKPEKKKNRCQDDILLQSDNVLQQAFLNELASPLKPSKLFATPAKTSSGGSTTASTPGNSGGSSTDPGRLSEALPKSGAVPWTFITTHDTSSWDLYNSTCGFAYIYIYILYY